MTREEVALIGFEIVAFAGDARSKLMKALNMAKNGEFDNIQPVLDEANELISKAHQAQTEMLQKEAGGEAIDIGFIMVHGQDHLMTTMLLRDMVQHFIELYKK